MSTQIAVKLPTQVLDQIDRLVAEGAFASRSQAVRTALHRMLGEMASAQIDHGFADGFRRHPETREELAEAERLAVEAIEAEPWERWW